MQIIADDGKIKSTERGEINRHQESELDLARLTDRLAYSCCQMLSNATCLAQIPTFIG